MNYTSFNTAPDAVLWLEICGVMFVLCVLILRHFHKRTLRFSTYHETEFMFFRVLEVILIVITIVTGLVSLISLGFIMKIL